MHRIKIVTIFNFSKISKISIFAANKNKSNTVI